MSNAIVQGSLAAIAEASGSSIAEAFISADSIIVVDVSASMKSSDSRGGRTRYDVACQELKQLQASLPGKIAVVAFSGDPQFCPSGVPVYIGMSTALAEALDFVHVADDTGMRFIVISDGEPDDERSALRAAKRFVSKIDTIFVGPEGGAGEDFLRRLAAASGGSAIQAHQVRELASGVQKLLTAGAL